MFGLTQSQRHQLNISFDAPRVNILPPAFQQQIASRTPYSVSFTSAGIQNAAVATSASTTSLSTIAFIWMALDGVQLPCVVRSGSFYVPVRVTEQKLLRPLMTACPSVATKTKRPLLTSYYVTPAEAAILTTHAGCTEGRFIAGVDLVVAYDDFQSFYAELKANSVSLTKPTCTGGWVQINNR